MKPAKKLKTLVQHSVDTIRAWRPALPTGPNGIACPGCGAELEDCGEGGAKFLDAPPGVRVECKGCDFRGSRYLLPDEARKI